MFITILKKTLIQPQETIPRKYFSGGMLLEPSKAMIVQTVLPNSAVLESEGEQDFDVQAGVSAAGINTGVEVSEGVKEQLADTRWLKISGRVKEMLNLKRTTQATQERKRVLNILGGVQNFVMGSDLLRNLPRHTLDRIRNVEIIVADDVPHFVTIYHRGEFK